jgi:predicted secreted hydrolase
MASGELGTLALALSTRLVRPVAWGPDYVSYKTADHTRFSRYHSYPRMSVRGTFTPKGEQPRAVSGAAWYDHEWSDGERDPELLGWDWFGLRFGDGRSLMLYRMRGADGETRHLRDRERDRWFGRLGLGGGAHDPHAALGEPANGASYPVARRIRIEPGSARADRPDGRGGNRSW